jgi:hypothetical protein
MKFVILPDGQRVDIDGGAYHTDGFLTITLLTSAGVSFSYACISAANLGQLVAAIDTFVGTNNNISSNPIISSGGGSPFAWTSITPNTTPIGSNAIFAVVGTGFTSAINTVKFDDGTHSCITNVTVSDNANLIIGGGDNTHFDGAGVYTLYYSTDGGATFNTTGLTVTAS